MKYTIFAHDHRFRRINGMIYSPGGLSNEVLERYVNYYGKIVIIARIYDENQLNKKYSLIDNENIDIKSYNDISKDELFELIDNSEYVIVRLPSRIGNKLYKYSKKKNKRIVTEVVGCVFDSYWNYNIFGKILAPFAYLKTRKIVRESNKVLYVSNNFLQKRYPTKGINIACSDVCLPKLDELILKERIKKINNLKNNKKIIFGTCGAVNVKYKGQEHVIKAIQILKEMGYNNFEYQLVGGGNGDRLLNIAKKCEVLENLKIIGSLPHDKVFDWLDEIDIYIQPSNLEGLCRALVEAMSRALPCIASNVGGNPELIDEKYLFKKSNIKDLVNKIINILSNMNEEAVRNFYIAREYEKEKLDKKREDFYTMVGGNDE